MNKESFWKIINKVHLESKGDMDAKCELLTSTLSSLDNKELIEFSEIFDELDRESYSWELWAAAYILNGGCSDDSFTDFRSTLISMGENIYLSAIANPASLSTVEFYENDCCYEGYAYAINDALEEKLGELPKSKIPFPESPSGKEWEEDKVESLYPELSYLEEEIEGNVNPDPTLKKPWWKFW